ncbi:hypothetical protein BHM03_00061402 [Ensete ventricosum]|nr:hypothetical protein BHM03_00061402 [Ensete ventricosum]
MRKIFVCLICAKSTAALAPPLLLVYKSHLGQLRRLVKCPPSSEPASTGPSRVADLGFPKHQMTHLDMPRTHSTVVEPSDDPSIG